MINSLYLDTSVFGGYFDEEFSKSTITLFDRILSENIQLVISEVLIAELRNAPKRVNDLIEIIPEK